MIRNIIAISFKPWSYDREFNKIHFKIHHWDPTIKAWGKRYEKYHGGDFFEVFRDFLASLGHKAEMCYVLSKGKRYIKVEYKGEWTRDEYFHESYNLDKQLCDQWKNVWGKATPIPLKDIIIRRLADDAQFLLASVAFASQANGAQNTLDLLNRFDITPCGAF